MGEEKTYPINDTYRAIGKLMDDLRAWNSPRCNRTARAVILNRLKEAQFWALELVDPEDHSGDFGHTDDGREIPPP